MNIVNKLTLRHLKQNKRRTLVTIIGVIISVAMVTAVSTLVVSFMDMMQRQSIANEGEWHVLYKNVNKEQINAIKTDEETSTVALSRDIGYAQLEESVHKPYLFIKEYNEQGFKQFPLEIVEGRFPQASDEVVISEEIADRSSVVYKIGDTLKLEIGERYSPQMKGNIPDQTFSLVTDENGEMDEYLKITGEKEFTVVGTIKRPSWEVAWAPGYTVLSYLDEASLGAKEQVNATVVLQKVKRSLFKHAEQLAGQIGVPTDSMGYNDELLRYYGVISNSSLNYTLYLLATIIMMIIMIGSIALIYNAFAISVSERARHLGMLSSVGATRIQKRNSVLFEGIVIGIISIPIGVIAGLVGIGVTFTFLNSIVYGALGVTEELRVTITPLSIFSACLVSALTIFISVYLPARRASRISAIDAIRQTGDVKLTSKAVKTSKWVRKLFGIEAEIGLKNLKRNRRRYKATVFSLVISIVLFLSVSYFTDNFKKALSLSQDGVNFDVQVQLDLEKEENKQLLEKIITSPDVTKYSLKKEIGLLSWIDEARIADELRDVVQDGEFPYFINVHALDDQSLKEFTKEAGINYNDVNQEMAAIVVDTISYEDQENHKYVETKAIHTKIGETIDLYWEDWETDEKTYLNQVKVAALTDQFPMGVGQAYLGNLNLIVSEQTMEHLLNENIEENVQTLLYVNSEHPMKTQQQIEEIEDFKHYIFNTYQNHQQEKQMIIFMSVFAYGFIALISAISIANIFNTISTSIALRKREFAMLKSVGLTSKGFNRMLNYESVFYGFKSLLYGLPLSFICMYLMHRALGNSFSFAFALPWLSIVYVIVAVFIVVGVSMLYSSSKIKKENIIDSIKQESV